MTVDARPEAIFNGANFSGMLAAMSHELRTPLNAIIGFSEALRDGLIGKMSDAQREHAGDILASGEHLLSLINDMLELSKAEVGTGALKLEPVELKSLLANCLSIVRAQAAARIVSLEVRIGDGLERLELDPRKTKQIVYNLLSNAVRFSASGGCVTLRARRVERRTVGRLPGAWPVHAFPLAENEHAEFLEISVSDTGIGLSRDSLARKFEGTGHGLAMVKQLTELLGGVVAVASAEGEGARFAVWLPLRAPAQAAPIGPRAAAAAAAATATATATAAPAVDPLKRIALVIDDDDRMAELLSLFLDAEGFAVVRARSAEDALLQAPLQTLALITLDLGLYTMNGWQFLLKLRENRILADVPVVVISGRPVGDLALTRGAAAVLQKPMTRGQLQETLAGLGLLPARS